MLTYINALFYMYYSVWNNIGDTFLLYGVLSNVS